MTAEIAICPSTDVIGSRAALISIFESTAAWRMSLVERFPDDRRNTRAAEQLNRLAGSINDIPDSLMLLYMEAAQREPEKMRAEEDELLKAIGFRQSFANAIYFIDSLLLEADPTREKVYATTDSDGGKIFANANISMFATREAVNYFLTPDPDEEPEDRIPFTIIDGSFGDCWIKTHSDPYEGFIDFAPFELDDLNIDIRGDNSWWITPCEDILILSFD